ncbi:L-type lectin-domain containing receptor kinase IV.1-like isoform X2 [Diospyros lotus]|uniref:L-type lectin-domain containing receptor kinase IV.1-like isoform X2 n=1 Tax=Diospyros lotus TaxID=55363 RepID=UPI002250243A|nr:L-type lectin-domain containing receptor kinase IV.1-like isoform X2 [Diospyros lotus]
MLLKLLVLLLPLLPQSATADDSHFAFNGFKSDNLRLDGIASFTPDGLLVLTNGTTEKTSHAFYPRPVRFKNSPAGSALSFSTTFVFGIIPRDPTIGGQGVFVFVVAPQPGLSGGLPNQHLGQFNEHNDGEETNRVVAVEFGTMHNSDLNENHVGIDINGSNSVEAPTADYYVEKTHRFQNLSLISGKEMQVWVEYHGSEKTMDVTIAPIDVGKPSKPLLSLSRDLSPIINQTMYVGFSSSTCSVVTSYYILGWSLKINGEAQPLDLRELPKLPRMAPKKTSKFLTVGLPLISLAPVFAAISGVVFLLERRRKFAEVVEEWEREYGTHRFKFKDLHIATKGFREKELLGSGGFGRVYGGVLPTSKLEIAVKRVSHESRQGMKEFVAEIVSLGRLRHRNLVPLLGYCRRKGELLLVYDYMPNGSLDKFLYDQPKFTLNWQQRFKVIKGVASGLFYLHEEWEQVVIHRDVKASNVLLDGELNGRLGDFGLARLHDHGTGPQTTHVVGTIGYIAPEHTRTGKASTSTDVYAFGAFLLEVASGRRPIEASNMGGGTVLVDWVFCLWSKGEIIRAMDANLGGKYVVEQAELVLKLGLLCSHGEPAMRPTMRQVVQYLEGDVGLPELASIGITATELTFSNPEGFSDFALPYQSSMDKGFTTSSSVAESFLSGGR